jgi:hypothetical protein
MSLEASPKPLEHSPKSLELLPKPLERSVVPLVLLITNYKWSLRWYINYVDFQFAIYCLLLTAYCYTKKVFLLLFFISYLLICSHGCSYNRLFRTFSCLLHFLK